MKDKIRFFLTVILLFFLIGSCFFIPQLAALSSEHEALFYQKLGKNNVQCQLCPRICVISPGKRGFCRVRENRDGILYALTYGKAVSAHPYDPIEKKPFFHYLPGTFTFSLATAGCNLKCKFCQNWEISQRAPEEVDYLYLDPEEVVVRVKGSGRNIIAYTYNEPVVFFEYMLDIAKAAKAQGLKNVMHSNGYINPGPLRQLAKYLAAANIDLKGFTAEYYSRISEGTLDPVLESLKVLKSEGVHIEITTLVLPGYNDGPQDMRKMCLWIKDNLGADTPLHLSRFTPMYKLTNLALTPAKTLESCRQIAMECGLKYVYLGNLPGVSAENTYCPKCQKLIVGRKGFVVYENNIIDGKCKFCQEKIDGVWN